MAERLSEGLHGTSLVRTGTDPSTIKQHTNAWVSEQAQLQSQNISGTLNPDEVSSTSATEDIRTESGECVDFEGGAS